MRLRPFFTYFGGKWRIARYYPPPKYQTIVEPFAGSAGYSLTYSNRRVVLYEVDPVIAGLWAYLIRVKQSDILSLPIKIEHVDDVKNNCQEAKSLIGFWLNKGSARPCKTPSTWMRSGTRPNSYWGEAIRCVIANQLHWIRHWKVFNTSYNHADNITATWFVDPPYIQAGKEYKFGSKLINYDRLAVYCKLRLGQTIVCENQGAEWLPFTQFRTAQGTPGKTRSGTSVEVIWTNNNLIYA